MKAFLLAAGLGTRLRPLTDNIPKCLVEINGKPLLEWWIKLFERHGISEVLINLHHLPDQVRHYIYSYDTKIDFHLCFEEELLGSAGTLRKNRSFVENESHFLVTYADNLTNYDLSFFEQFHLSHKLPASIALFTTDSPGTKGIIEIDDDNTVISFEEKPLNPVSDLANAGIYIFSPEILDLIPEKEITDIGYDLLPQLINKMKGWHTEEFLIDIGTFAHLTFANEIWPKILERKNLNLPEYKNTFINTLNSLNESEIEKFIELIIRHFENDTSIFVIGNGGSAANASHFAQDLAKGTRKTLDTIKRIKAISLTDNVAFLTALGNDDGYENIFVQQLQTFAKAGDLMIAISGSGNSPNIIKAVEWANLNGIITVGVTGFGGGTLRNINAHSVHVPLNDMCTAESVHSFIFHYVILKLQERLWQ